jgi:aspartate racemase
MEANGMTIDREFLAPEQRYVPGILGGLGPLSHVEFERTILERNARRRGAGGDQAHPFWLLASGSPAPDRTAALLRGGASPLAHLTAYAQLLERAGADALFVICNTAHAWHDEVQRALGIPWVHLMDLVAGALRADFPEGTRIGLLATDGTMAAGLYHRALERRGLVPVAPPADSAAQAQVRAALFDPEFGIKVTGAAVLPRAREALVDAAGWCVEHGAQVVVPACTEVSVGLRAGDVPVPLWDPLDVAADALLDLSYGRREPAAFSGRGETR